MKILILTDSLSLPRVVGKDEVLYEQTYPYLLKQNRPEDEIIAVGIGGGTVYDINRQVDYYKVFRPDVVFIQVGIVDAAPRAFTRIELQVLQKLRLIGIFMKFKNQIRTLRNKHYTERSMFEKYIKGIQQKIVKLNPNAQIYFIGILPTSEDYEKILPGITQNVNQYNEVLKANGTYIETTDIDTEIDILDDHHHLSSSGHQKIANKVSEVLKNTEEM